MFKLLIIFSLVLTLNAKKNDILNINLSNHTLDVEYSNYINVKEDRGDMSDFYLDFGALISDKYTDIGRQILLYAELKIIDTLVTDNGWGKGMSMKLVSIHQDSVSFSALAIGFYVKKVINEDIFITSNAHIAPSITTFSEGKNYNDFDISAHYQLFASGDIYLGLRSVDFNINEYDKNKAMDHSLYVGTLIKF